MVFSCCLAAGAAETDKTLSFNADGNIRIMQINDTQDVGEGANEKMLAFVAAALDAEQPDLVVFNGDQLSDVYTFPSAEDYAIAIDKVCGLCEERGIPFVATLGNHDHDRASVLSESEMIHLYDRYDMWYGNSDGPDPFTYNVPIMSSDGSRVALNLYIMDSNNKADEGGYSGINADQLQWYKDTSDALKAANGGEVVPSLLFQHVPVKEIYQLMEPCDYNDEGAVYVRRGDDKGFYRANPDRIVDGTLGEAPCSEDFTTITGEYQAWVEKGDIIGAWFAHDHVNSFSGYSDDGILMGYNAGATFRSYGDGGNRSVRVFDINENDVENYSTSLVTYNDLMDDIDFVLVDLFSPTLLTTLMKVVYFFFGWIINLVKG